MKISASAKCKGSTYEAEIIAPRVDLSYYHVTIRVDGRELGDFIYDVEAEEIEELADRIDAAAVKKLVNALDRAMAAAEDEADAVSPDATPPSYSVIFDAAGGTTIQFHDEAWAHRFDDGAAAAAALRRYVTGDHTWVLDRHDADALALEPSADDIRRGAYVVRHDADDAKRSSAWVNERDFAAAWFGY